MNIYFTATLNTPFTEAIKKVKDALSLQGFGVITEINVTSTLKAKLGIDFKNYLIIGACNPHYAHQAISNNDNVGLLLPCNVIVYEKENEIIVSTIKPTNMLSILGDKKVCEVGALAEEKLKLVFESLNN